MATIGEAKQVGIELLIPYVNNAKKHSDEQVAKIASSIREFGFVNPVLIDKDYNIIAGHGRVMAARKLKLTEVPCVFIEGLTETQRKAYILADNRLGELADWDMELVGLELDALDLDGFDTSLTGFDLFGDDEPAEVVEDDVPKQAEPRCKLGDLWQLGNHRLICGDSTDVVVVDRLMDGAKADIAITSPPYGESNSAPIRQHYERGKKRIDSLYKNHDDDIQSWFDLINGSFKVMKGASTAQFINIQMLADNKRDLLRFLNDNKDCFVDVIVWDKKKAPPQMESNILNNGFEFIFCFYEDGASRKIPFGNFHGNTTNIIELSVGHNDYAEIHKAVYPVGLPAKIMEIASKAGSVLDVFGGTGTTMIACEQLNRKCYMAELDPHYCDVIIERWENLTGEKAIFISE